MKSEFILAFNEICEQRGLPKEDVFDALKTALASAYRRDMNVSNTQQVIAEIDSRTGEPTIYAEKEIVDSIFDGRTEVLMKDVPRLSHPDTDVDSLEMGDLVLVDSTTATFGRIAAQTAKQVLLQRVREAEREQLFEDFSGREGELVNGTVQSISGQHITIGLGRTEAILPKSQQVRGERYRAHDKIRVYVLEVRRTSRGPQIFVSRNHRNLLRRLLELEVPEIYNGQVEIKSIAREAGQRSKVAVMALQPGVDPVGACVGMRGVRIQSIVRELNDEKIDVIEWNPDQETFIAKALSPARVSHVFLDDHPDDGKTAVVVVPDDQLSLAIGREGQNARLGAKLTGWRIDIKSLTESASESLERLDAPVVKASVREDEQHLEQVRAILAKKAAGRPITSEDYFTMDRLVNAVEGQIIAARSAKHEEVRQRRAEARKQVPAVAWELPLDELDLPGRIHNLLLDNEVETVGHVLMNQAIGDDVFLNYRGFGDKALDTLKEYVANYKLPEPEVADETETEGVLVDGAEVEAETEAEVAAGELVEAAVETAADAAVEAPPEPEPEVEPAEAEEPEEEALPAIDDLSRPLVEIEEEPKSKKAPEKKPAVVIARPSREEERLQEQEKQSHRKGKRLVFDEDMGEVVIKRKRKRGRGCPEWEEFEGSDFDLDDI